MTKKVSTENLIKEKRHVRIKEFFSIKIFQTTATEWIL